MRILFGIFVPDVFTAVSKVGSSVLLTFVITRVFHTPDAAIDTENNIETCIHFNPKWILRRQLIWPVV